MKQATIDIVTPHGAFVTADGTRMKKWIVTFDDNTDGVAFASTDKPWWTVGDIVWYEITGHVNGRDHVKIRRTNTAHAPAQNTSWPFVTRLQSERWRWAIAQAVQARHAMPDGPSPTYFADVEADAIRFEMMLERLEKK